MDESLAGELRCPVCLEFLNVPIILPCSHVLCRAPCGERLFRDEFVRCPVCRENSLVTGGVESLPRVITIEHIIEQLQIQPPAIEGPEPVVPEPCGPGDIPCQLCSDESSARAVRSCLVCNVSYCERCLAISHPEREPFTQHELVEPRKIPKPKPIKCIYHDMPVNLYCQKCQVLACPQCGDDPSAHKEHSIQALEEAMPKVKKNMERDIEKINDCQDAVREAVRKVREKLTTFEALVDDRKKHINDQCDSLISEIEIKRDFFVSDIEYESRSKADILHDHIDGHLDKISSLQGLLHYTQQVLKESDQYSFLQLAKTVKDRVDKTVELPTDVTPCPLATSPNALNSKVVDFRKERAILQDLAYLTIAGTPSIIIDKCSRSTSSVVLVLDQPGIEYEVIDGYKVFYCTENEKPEDKWDMMEFKAPGEERKCGRGPPSGNAICLIHDNLRGGTMYYFCVRAYNASGESEMSDIVNCMTLSVSQSVLPVPEIRENQCRAYTYSIQLHSPSPLEVLSESGVSHYLLYRESDVNKIWKSISLYGRVDHRVFGLQPDTMYDFVIMACNKNGECQVSNQVTMATERSAY